MKPTADLCDDLGPGVQICRPVFRDYGGLERFGGPIVTLRAVEDNSWVRRTLSEGGEGRVLVIDGGAAMTCALLGGNLGKMAETNGWAGLVINGCIRDVDEVRECRIGVKALASHPRKSRKHGVGERDVPLRFADVQFLPGARLAADLDGIVIFGAEDR